MSKSIASSLFLLSLMSGIGATSPARVQAEPPLEVKADLQGPFDQQGMKGVFVLYDPGTGKSVTNDLKRARERFIPASTFKIPNSLIGLSTGAVKSVEEVLPYGGKPQYIKEWEKDMDLRDAIKVSNVAVYQELARRIGLPRMKENLAAYDYGNMDPGSVVDQFWLSGPLKISALEQTQFLARLVEGRLPAPPEALAAVKEITILESSDVAELHAKTGWCVAYKPDIGWWVGWVQPKNSPSGWVTFALNIDMDGVKDAPKRLVIGKECLKLLNVRL